MTASPLMGSASRLTSRIPCCFPLRQVQTILDRYATLGKELHITEFTPASGGDPITESHVEGVWDEAAQADYAVKFYRVTVARTRSNGVIVTWYGPSKCLSDSAAALGLTTPMKNAHAGRRQNPQVFFSPFRLCLKESCGCRRVPDLFFVDDPVPWAEKRCQEPSNDNGRVTR